MKSNKVKLVTEMIKIIFVMRIVVGLKEFMTLKSIIFTTVTKYNKQI